MTNRISILRSNPFDRVCRWLLIAALAAMVGGCITTEEGGLPEPAPDDERVQAQLDLARGYQGNRDWGRARGPLQKALEINPRSADAHVLQSILYQAENEPTLAERALKRALSYEPNNPIALNNYGTFLYERGRFAEAAVQLAKVAADTEYPRRAQSYENLGLVLRKLDDDAGALEALERAVELNSRQARAHLEIADIRLIEGDVTAAQTHFDFFRRLARQTSRSLCLGMQISAAAGDDDGISSYAMALGNLYPDSAEASDCQANPQ